MMTTMETTKAAQMKKVVGDRPVLPPRPVQKAEHPTPASCMPLCRASLQNTQQQAARELMRSGVEGEVLMYYRYYGPHQIH